METMVIAVPVDARGERLDVFLAGRAELGLTRSAVQSLIRRDLILVGDRPGKAGDRLREGEQVTVTLPPPQPARALPEPIPLDVVYEDGDVAVVNKARGMVVHPAPGHAGGTLVNALLARCPELWAAGDAVRPGIVHRLDRDTTGLLVVAKSRAAHEALARQLKERTMRREYLALVHGQPPDEGTVDAPIGRHTADRKRMAVVARGRPAVTRYRVVERFPAPRGTVAGARGGGYALLAVRLETGRTHQIRVHMAHIGHRVAGDPVYGARRPRRGGGGGGAGTGAGGAGELGLAAQALHAARLGFAHPRTREWMEFEAPPPPDLAAALDRLRRGAG